MIDWRVVAMRDAKFIPRLAVISMVYAVVPQPPRSPRHVPFSYPPADRCGGNQREATTAH